MNLTRLMEEIIHYRQLTPAEELHLIGDFLLLLSHPKEVKDRWYRIKQMNTKHFCTYVFTSGEREGDMCGKMIKDNGEEYCSIHQKLKSESCSSSNSSSKSLLRSFTKTLSSRSSAVLETPPVVSIPYKHSSLSTTKAPSTSSYTGASGYSGLARMKPIIPEQNTEKPKKSPKLKEEIVIYQNRFKNFVYPGTNLILDDKNVVVAAEGDQGEWLPLTSEDIREAKSRHLRYKIIDLEQKGEEAPPDMKNIQRYRDQPPTESSYTYTSSTPSSSYSLNPSDMFVYRPNSNPDANLIFED